MPPSYPANRPFACAPLLRNFGANIRAKFFFKIKFNFPSYKKTLSNTQKSKKILNFIFLWLQIYQTSKTN